MCGAVNLGYDHGRPWCGNKLPATPHNWLINKSKLHAVAATRTSVRVQLQLTTQGKEDCSKAYCRQSSMSRNTHAHDTDQCGHGAAEGIDPAHRPSVPHRLCRACNKASILAYYNRSGTTRMDPFPQERWSQLEVPFLPLLGARKTTDVWHTNCLVFLFFQSVHRSTADHGS